MQHPKQDDPTPQTDLPAAPLPLAGVRVIDLTRALAGPFCTMILADLGADVIKVEPAGEGDMSRAWGPLDRGISTYYLSSNRNKRDLAINFRHPQAMPLLKRLIGKSDVVVENFRSGVMQKMGLDYESLSAANPGLVYAGISGFGRSGPAADWSGFDQIAQGYSGLMSITGTAASGPMRMGVAIGDQASGMWAAMGILASLLQRTHTGQGQRVETSLLSSLMGLLSVQGQRYLSLGEIPVPSGNAHPVITPYGLFQTADGPLNLAPATTDMWLRLCRVLELPELPADPRFIDNTARTSNRDALQEILESRLKLRTRQAWTLIFLDEGIPAGPINGLDDVFADAQVQHCQLVQQVNHPVLGMVKQVANPIEIDALKGRSVRTAPPMLGQHTREVLDEFGLEPAEIQALLDEGVVAQHA